MRLNFNLLELVRRMYIMCKYIYIQVYICKAHAYKVKQGIQVKLVVRRYIKTDFALQEKIKHNF